jgi:hypothetical protein
MKRSAVVLAAVLFSTTTAFAQEYELTRRSIPFFDNKLTIEVIADMAGELQIVRGEQGMIEVAARVPGGVPAFALGGRESDRLRLTAIGGEAASFVVIVPEDAMVRVLLPGESAHQVGSLQKTGRYSWDAETTKGSGGASSVKATSAVATAAVSTSPVLAYSNPLVPRNVNVPRLNSVRTVSVRFEGTTFNVAGTQAMSVANGDPSNIEIRTGSDVQDVVVTLPVGTSDFGLKLGGKAAMQVVGGEIRVYCEPLTEQELGAGRRWFTFTPEMGRLTCR